MRDVVFASEVFYFMIALIGFTGAGKSTLGARLQGELGIPCYDVDEMIEERQQMKIADIFAAYGEAFFRRLEAETIRSCAGRPAGVVVTGGGAVLNPETRRWLSENCLVVHVHAPLDVIVERLSAMRDRPLLGTADREKALRDMYEARRGVYDFAAIKVDGADGLGSASLIAAAWSKWRQEH